MLQTFSSNFDHQSLLSNGTCRFQSQEKKVSTIQNRKILFGKSVGNWGGGVYKKEESSQQESQEMIIHLILIDQNDRQEVIDATCR